MAFAPSQPENSGEREFSLLVDEVERMRLFNEELDGRAARLAEREREFERERETERKIIEEMREFQGYKDYQASLQEQRQRDEWASYNAHLADLRQLETTLLAREQLQRGREAELAHWQSSLEAREDELATAQAQLGEEREAFARRVRRYDEESSPVSPPPEGDF